MQDLRYAVRSLSRTPAFLASVVLTFALAIGANTAMFGLLGRLLITAPPGVSEPDRVTRIGLEYVTSDGEAYTAPSTSYPMLRAWQDAKAAFTSVAGVRHDTLNVGRSGDIEQLPAVIASGDYFDVLGAKPHIGRFFSAADDQLPAGSPVAVLGYRYWQRRFESDRAVLGREVVISGQPYTIVGVASRGFTGDDLEAAALFIPMSAAFSRNGSGWISSTGMNILTAIARLAPGVSLSQAASVAASSTKSVLGDGGSAIRLSGANLATLLPGREAFERSPQARIVLWLSGVALIVLIVATANVGTLFLLRARRRRREIAVRVALGVSRGRLAGQLLTESLLLAFAGGVAGLVLQRWIADLISATVLPGVSLAENLIDLRLVVGTMLAATAAGVFAGLIPLLQLDNPDVQAGLRDGEEGGRVRAWTLRNTLVASQVALCTVVLAGAGLFVRSLQRVQGQDLGYTLDRLMVVHLDFRDRMPGAERDAIHRDLAARVAYVPGVTGATVVQALPFGSHNTPPISIPGHSEPPNVGGQIPTMYGATPEYLRLMGVSLREGRLFNAQDAKGAQPVALVNETFARGAWPGESALGKCIRMGFLPGVEPTGPLASELLPCREVVGVVADSRVRSIRGEGNEAHLMQYYIPFEQLPPFPFGDIPQASGLLVQTAGNPEATLGAVQRFIAGALAQPAFVEAQPYEELLEPSMRSWRLGATVFTAFGAMALAMAAVGLFGVISYLVAQRTREIGVRLALGGSSGGIQRMVIGDAVRLGGVGVVAGLAVALIAAPLIRDLLFQTSPREAGVLFGVATLLVGVTVLAAALPAWRAARVDAMEVLKA